MRKVIDKKVYDTQTAELIAEYSNRLYGRFDYEEEALYRSPKGAYFLYGTGGPRSSYAETNGREWWGSNKIIPYTRKEAFEWLQEYNFVEEIEEEFADFIEEA